MTKKIVDFLINYFIVAVAMFTALAILFGIYLGFMVVWNYNAILFGFLVIILIVSGVITYIITEKEGEE